MLWNLLVGLRCYVWAGLHESLQPCSRAARKWRENEEMRRKWRENEEMERDWLSTFPHSLSISSLFLHFLPLFPFPTSKCITFCCKMLNTALLSRMSQKSQHTRYEEIILGRTCCEEAPQFVPACPSVANAICVSSSPSLSVMSILKHFVIVVIALYASLAKLNKLVNFAKWGWKCPHSPKRVKLYCVIQVKLYTENYHSSVNALWLCEVGLVPD